MPAKFIQSGPLYYANTIINAFSVQHPPPPATVLSIRLVTVGISHYCEKGRWALDLSSSSEEQPPSSSLPAVDYIEDAHPPGLASFAALSLSKTVSAAPVVLVRDVQASRSYVLSDSTTILQRLAPFLYSSPSHGENENEVELWEEELDRRLGATARCWVYHTLLDVKQRPVLVRMATKDTSLVESMVFKALVSRGGLSSSMRKLMRIDDGTAASSLAEIRAVFDEVGEALKRGKAEGGSGNFLVHERFTAADLTFAALAGPVLLPPQLAHTYPKLAELPEETRKVILELRGTAAGMYAMETYDRFRFAKHQQRLEGGGGAGGGAALPRREGFNNNKNKINVVKPVEKGASTRTVVTYRSGGLSRTRKLPLVALGAALVATSTLAASQLWFSS